MRILGAASLLVMTSVAIPAGAQKPNVGNLAQINGTQIHYEECGSGPEAVVLLHDGVANSAVWDQVWPSFCKQFHTVRYDRRGYGRSPETKGPYYEADDLAALLNQLKISRIALLGSSHGGQVAMEFAYRYPKYVSHLILVAPGVEGFPYSEYFLMRQYSDQKVKSVSDQIEAAVRNESLIVPGHDDARKRLRDILTASPQDLTHNDMHLPEPPNFPNVRDLRVPTLILIGSGDSGDNHAVTGALVMTIPGAQRVVVPNTGHLMYLEKPQEFCNEVSRFLTLHRFHE